MHLVDAAAEILRQSPSEVLAVREIAERAIAEGLIAPKSQSPWGPMADVMRQEVRRYEQGGEPTRFERVGPGKYRYAGNPVPT